MNLYYPKLVDGTDDQYKIYFNNRAQMLCDDQLDEPFVKLHSVLLLIDSCEGDLDFLKFKLKGMLHDPTT